MSNDRLISEHKSGFFFIKPSKSVEKIPLTCPHCKLMMKDASDPYYYREYKCCSGCAIKWAEGANKEKWLAGWRPSKEETREIFKLWKKLRNN